MIDKRIACVAALCIATGLVGRGLMAQQHEHEGPMHGVCVVTPASGSNVKGKLALVQQGETLHVAGEISGLTPGLHGFHVHEFGDLSSPDGMSTGAHFNPAGHDHAGPDKENRHAGDLGNITAGENGVAKVDVKVSGVELHFLLGRAIVVHAAPDDLTTQPSGNAGARIGVGVIGVAKPPAN